MRGFFEPEAEESGVRLVLSAVGPFTVHGDRDLCFKALSNLIDNAVKFTPPGGTVQVAVAWTGQAIEVAVEDTGPGLPASEHDICGPAATR
ncbi:signal transduction histidine kinase [Methylobacterium sp. PvP062]|uniref:histidine kinase n=1 Tax=Methylobacterium radiotolerans TaxID=31998 RepID=A0ABV2NBX7_9HYPH|nr:MULTISPECIES: ATP-binding protein [unclassified Methylobacterium]KZC00887.1 Adaptive-response sensory-kinase SasA [Methylobacterium radiotolerans]MBP2492754.1 signal transduction histidine kinase [Methylobacterium sp. PvP105]MBP2500874.1 signal transduction histidine kinase [Methylobacterium sp. PvP109]